MHDNKKTNFSQLVCGASEVQGAFAEHQPTRVWWQWILALHGKPTQLSMTRAEKFERVAEGFKFYAWLYRLLAAVFFVLAPTLYALTFVDSGVASTYWATASLLAAVYLWCVSGLGYAGAKSFGAGREPGTIVLIAFMVMVVAFLSMFVAVVSVVAQHSDWLATTPNLAAAGLLFVFGVGSYMIEIVYLATEYRAEG